MPKYRVLFLIVTVGTLLSALSIAYAEKIKPTLPANPTNGSVSSGFGWRVDPLGQGTRFHAGLDIAAPKGTAIYATQRAVVAYSGKYKGYGNLIALAHGQGLYTMYGHASALFVQNGQVVDKGQIIGSVGSTGRSTGSHLHFEVHQNGKYVNPVQYLGRAELSRPIAKPSITIASAALPAITGNKPQKLIAKTHVINRARYYQNPYKAPTTVFMNEENLYDVTE